MSHSRFKNRQPQFDRFSQNRGPQRHIGEQSGQEYNREMENSRERSSRPYSRPWDYGPQYSEEQERYGAQSGYEGGFVGSAGSYGRQGGYQQNNFVPGVYEESDFSFGSDYVRDERAYRPSRMKGRAESAAHPAGRHQWLLL